ncbi:hypothetical protein FHS18_005569 [Paenibacillus phyllosphaerae]|uniref:Uncharacterized protein n=1 Tax=Paenibacillus phyllosphaerae TaxID=274593 RepID=A0A7W5FQP4_9BACL|nr:hypothetical protein [Paenibacillus phyllosphaerae]MBB3113457.1 hypothetical protein [Paenibacillus phyllosphaerae]
MVEFKVKMVLPDRFYQVKLTQSDREEVSISNGIYGEAIYCSLFLEWNQISADQIILELSFEDLPDNLRIRHFAGVSKELANLICMCSQERELDFDILIAPQYKFHDTEVLRENTVDEVYTKMVSKDCSRYKQIIINPKYIPNIKISKIFNAESSEN